MMLAAWRSTSRERPSRLPRRELIILVPRESTVDDGYDGITLRIVYRWKERARPMRRAEESQAAHRS